MHGQQYIYIKKKTLDSYGLFNNAVSSSKCITHKNLRLMNKELERMWKEAAMD